MVRTLNRYIVKALHREAVAMLRVYRVSRLDHFPIHASRFNASTLQRFNLFSQSVIVTVVLLFTRLLSSSTSEAIIPRPGGGGCPAASR